MSGALVEYRHSHRRRCAHHRERSGELIGSTGSPSRPDRSADAEAIADAELGLAPPSSTVTLNSVQGLFLSPVTLNLFQGLFLPSVTLNLVQGLTAQDAETRSARQTAVQSDAETSSA